MPILFLCPSCGCKLKAPEGAGGRKVKCGGCSQVVQVPKEKAGAAFTDSGPRPEPAAVRKKVDPEPAPARGKVEPEPARVRKPVGSAEPEEDLPEPELVSEQQSEGLPRPARRKRKKKRKQLARSGPARSIPGWVWWWGSLAIVSFLTVAALIGIFASGYRLSAIWLTVYLMWMYPFALVAFCLSAVVASYLGSGFEFTEFSTLIPKVLLLTHLANLVSAFPFVGGWITIGVWMLGAVLFFHMDVWESKALVAINWAMGFIVKFFFIAFLMSLTLHGPDDKPDKDDGAPNGPPPAGQHQQQPDDEPDG